MQVSGFSLSGCFGTRFILSSRLVSSAPVSLQPYRHDFAGQAPLDEFAARKTTFPLVGFPNGSHAPWEMAYYSQALQRLSNPNLAVRELLCLPGTLGGLLVGIARRKLGMREGEEGSGRMADKRTESDGCHCEKPTGRVSLIRETLTSLSPSSVG